MNECPDHVDQAEVLAELQRLRKKIEQLEVNQSGRKPAQGFRHIHLTGRRLFLSLLGFATAVFLALVILGAQSKPDALFIDPNGNVGINQPSPQRTLDVNGDAVVRGQLQAKGTIPGTSHPLAANSGVVIGSSDLYFTDTAHQYTGQGNQQGSAAIENDSKDYKSLMILGRSRNPDCGKKPCDRVVSMFDRVGIRTSEPRADLDVNGGIVANGLDVRGGITATSQITADNVWVKIHEAQLNSAADYLIRGIDGNAYRRFRIEVEGTIGAGGTDRVISLRPNGSTTNYGPGSIHWQGHEPNVTWAHGVAWVGKSQPNFLPLCATHWGRDGNLMCTGEMNTQTGMFRMIDSNSVFSTSSTCGNNPAYPSCMIADNLENSWRDQTSNITWLILHFDGAPGFRGRFTLYGKK